jgi:DNA-binding LacI/PurR family transcriptional regulator
MGDVAAAAGVSHQTVSRVLNNSPLVRPDTRERVLQAIEAMGYRRNAVARALVTSRSGRIGVIAAHMGERGPAMIAGSLQDAALDAGYEVALVGLSEFTATSLRKAVDRVLDQSVEAIVVTLTHRHALTYLEQLPIHVPVVLTEGVVEGQPCTAGISQAAGAEQATRHLLDLGHTSVAHISGPLDWVEAVERQRGWRHAHDAVGATPGPSWSGDWSAASGYESGVLAAAEERVTAIFVGNDQMALGALLALHERGRRVPDDVSVVGFDDFPESAYFTPPLTTIRQDFGELARRAIDIVVRAIGGEEKPSSSLVQPTLIERRSTAPPSR